MRLTLRNMLAYMDELLEPAQQEEIRQKIEESEFATGILHRIRDVTRRMRLGAPKLTGKGMGLDPNTVAMYLDNTLLDESVPVFEKVCLESDMHLAEVAACHQILALVLGEPAEVSPALRRKLYETAQAVEAHKPPAPPKVPPPLPLSVPVAGRRERPHVPEYLRSERRSRFWTVAATALLALLLVAAVVRTLGPFDRTNPALAWLPNWGEDAAIAQNGDQPALDGGANAASSNAASNNGSSNNGNAATRTTSVDTAQPSGTADASQTTIKTTVKTDADAAAADIAKTAKLSNPIVSGDKAIPLDGPALSGDSKAASIPPVPQERPDAGDATPSDNNSKVIEPAADQSKEPRIDEAASARPAQPAVVRPVNAEPLGRFPTNPNVLLRLNRDGQWERVEQGATLNAGDRLLVLPTYRPTITLSAGLTLEILGETLVELLPTDQDGAPTLSIPYGKIVLMTTGKADVPVRLSLGGREGTATLLDAESTLAAEVRRYLPAGADPGLERAYVAIDLYASSGAIDWKESENPEPQRIAGPARLTLAEHPYDPGTDAELPKWIAADALSPIDQLASVPVNRALSLENDRPVALTLRELADDRPRGRPEVKYLATRSLALIDEFDSFPAAFGDSDQRAVWLKQYETLQASLARSSETAAKVREAFEKQRGGDDGYALYRMLWGYSKADIQKGAAAQLVEHLDHENLDFRVLAFLALKSVPGVSKDYTGNYRPEGTAENRRQPVRRWREYIKEGPLSPKGALDRPGPVPKNQPQAAAAEEESAALPGTLPLLQ